MQSCFNIMYDRLLYNLGHVETCFESGVFAEDDLPQAWHAFLKHECAFLYAQLCFGEA